MPGKETHSYVGVTAGAGYAAFQAKGQAPLNFLVEVAGGAVGGWYGGLLPDVIEPGTSSWHRSFAHSGTTGTGVVAVMKTTLTDWREFCYERSEYCRIQGEQIVVNMVPDALVPNLFVPAPPDPWTQVGWTLAALFWRFAAGFANGLAAGYVSHLALDALTPRSIPFLTRGL
jgi:hypothetical protein